MVQRTGLIPTGGNSPTTPEPQFLPVRIDPLALEAIKADIKLLESFVAKYLEADIDWGTEVGITYPFLHEPGADKVCAAFTCIPKPEILKFDIDEDRKSITAVVRQELVNRRTGQTIGYGLGVCSTKEGKYGARWTEHPEDEGYDPKSLRKRKKKDHPETIEYRIPNPDWGDLVHTIPQMAAKRGKVDAAQTLPGVSSALKRLFKMDDKAARRQEFARFYSEMHSLGVSHLDVHETLQVKSLYDWLETHTLREAREKILAAQGINNQEKQQATPLTLHSIEVVPEAPDGVDPELWLAWFNVKGTMKGMKLTDELVAKWWKGACAIEGVTLADFSQERPPEKFNTKMLSGFCDALAEARQKATTKRSNKATP